MLPNYGGNACYLTTVCASRRTANNTDNVVTTNFTYFWPRREVVCTQKLSIGALPHILRAGLHLFNTMYLSMKSCGRWVKNLTKCLGFFLYSFAALRTGFKTSVEQDLCGTEPSCCGSTDPSQCSNTVLEWGRDKLHKYLGAGKIRFLPPQPRTSQKQVYIQDKTTLSFGFMLESSAPLFAYTISLKKI